MGNFEIESCQLARKILRFNTFGFLFVGYAKDRVYANNPQTLDQLKANIREVMSEILSKMCRNFIQNYLKKLRPVEDI